MENNWSFTEFLRCSTNNLLHAIKWCACVDYKQNINRDSCYGCKRRTWKCCIDTFQETDLVPSGFVRMILVNHKVLKATIDHKCFLDYCCWSAAEHRNAENRITSSVLFTTAGKTTPISTEKRSNKFNCMCRVVSLIILRMKNRLHDDIENIVPHMSSSHFIQEFLPENVFSLISS